MTKLAFVVTGVGLTAMLLWASGSFDPTPHAAPSASQPSAARTVETALDGPGATLRRPGSVEAAEPGANNEAIDPLGSIRFTGRIVDETTRAPLAGVRVIIDPGDPNRLPGDPNAWDPDPSEVSSDSDGRFSVACDWPERQGRAVEVQLERDGYVDLHSYSSGLAPGRSNDLGEIGMLRAVSVRVRLVDESGNPWSRFAGTLMPASGSGRPDVVAGVLEFRPTFERWFRVDERGVSDPLALWPGRYSWSRDMSYGSAIRPPTDPSEPHFEILPTDGARDIVFVCPRPDPARTISGRIITTDGDPMVGVSATLEAVGGGSRLLALEPTTDDTGRFLRTGLEPGVSYRVEIEPTSRFTARGWEWQRWQVLAPIEGVRGGQTDLEIVARALRPNTISLRVLDPSGEPVERFSTALFEARRRESGQIWAYQAESGAASLSVAEKAPPGGVELRVEAGTYRAYVGQTGVESVPVQFLDFELEGFGEARQLELRLQQTDDVAVQVVDPSGRPVAADVEVVRDLVQRPTDVGPSRGAREDSFESVPDHAPGRDGFVLRLEHRTTGADGRTQVMQPSDSQRVFVRAHAEGYLPAIVAWPGSASDAATGRASSDSIRLVLERAATVTVEASPLEDLLAWCRKQEAIRQKLTRLDSITDPEEEFDAVPRLILRSLDESGVRFVSNFHPVDSYRFDRVPPGDYRVELDPRRAPDLVVRDRITVLASEDNHLNLDLGPWRPRSLRGRIRGSTLEQVTRWTDDRTGDPGVRLVSEDLTYHTNIDPGGGFEIWAIAPGRYEVTLDFVDTDRSQMHRVLLDEWVVVEAHFDTGSADAVAAVDLQLPESPLRVRVVDSSGVPVAGRRLRFEPVGSEFRPGLFGVTDEDGVISFIERPASRIRVFDLGADGAEEPPEPVLLPEIHCQPREATTAEVVVSR